MMTTSALGQEDRKANNQIKARIALLKPKNMNKIIEMAPYNLLSKKYYS